MIVPVRCFTCGTVLGSKWEEFQRRVSHGEEPREVLDKLGIDRYCCRALFLTHVDLLQTIGRYKINPE